MKRYTLPLLFLLFVSLLGAQSVTTPDCTQAATFTGVANGPVMQAKTGSGAGCSTIALTWYVTGFSAAKVHLQGSQDNATFADITTTALILEGSNPTSWTTSTVSNRIVIRAYLPYFRVVVDTLTGSGSLFTLMLGYKGSTAAPLSSSGGGGGSNVTIVSPIGQMPMAASVAVAIASDQSAVAENLTEVGGSAVALGQAASASSIPVVIASDQSAVPVTFASSSTVLSGQQSVTGSAVALATHTITSICVSASIANTINVYLGPSGVTTGTGRELSPGSGACLSITNSNLLFVIASTTGAAVSWLATN